MSNKIFFKVFLIENSNLCISSDCTILEGNSLRQGRLRASSLARAEFLELYQISFKMRPASFLI